jgi:hypothetical protein
MDGIQKGKKRSMELTMGKSLSIFKLGTNISNYLFFKHLFYPKNENIVYDYDVYEFVELNVDLYVRTDGIVDCITTHSSCVYMGRELINMYYDIFLYLFGLLPYKAISVFSEGPQKNGRNYNVYYFNQGITVWVWRKKIRSIQVDYIYEEDGEHIKL